MMTEIPDFRLFRFFSCDCRNWRLPLDYEVQTQ